MRAPSVVVIEEDADLLELLSLSLARLGPFRVEGASNEDAGFQRCQEIHPDCVIIDCRPLLSLQLVAALRRDTSIARTTPLIILTDRREDYQLFAHLASKVELVLLKPVLPSDLAIMIHQLLTLASAATWYAAYDLMIEALIHAEVQDERE